MFVCFCLCVSDVGMNCCFVWVVCCFDYRACVCCLLVVLVVFALVGLFVGLLAMFMSI